MNCPCGDKCTCNPCNCGKSHAAKKASRKASCDCEEGCTCGKECCENVEPDMMMDGQIFDTFSLTPAVDYMYDPMKERNDNKSYASLSKRKIV